MTAAICGPRCCSAQAACCAPRPAHQHVNSSIKYAAQLQQGQAAVWQQRRLAAAPSRSARLCCAAIGFDLPGAESNNKSEFTEGMDCGMNAHLSVWPSLYLAQLPAARRCLPWCPAAWQARRSTPRS